jgi:hypothetical protein
MWKKISFIGMVSILLIGCAAPRLVADRDKLTDNLDLKITYDSNIDSVAIALIDSATHTFVSNYNEQNHLFDVHLNNEANSNYLSIDIKNIEYVKSEIQVLSTLVTALGAATFLYTVSDPELGYYFLWWWLPHYSLTAKMHLSTDINYGSKPIMRSLSGFHSFESIEEQRTSIVSSFDEFLFDILKELEVNK